MTLTIRSLCILLLTISACIAVSAQGTAPVKKTPRPAADAIPSATPASQPTPGKRNERPTGSGPMTNAAALVPDHIYKYSRPGFLYTDIRVEHDENGRGRIYFKKNGSDEVIDDPIELSAPMLKGLNEAFAELNFLDSNENYQYEKDYSHLGNIEITLKRDGRSRTAKYNWTENKAAKFLMDEYRRISNEAIWKFEMSISRENQPLESPRIMDGFASYIQRNEISDPPHLIPFLNQIANDERLPLIARNHATRIIATIEKNAKKAKVGQEVMRYE